MPAEREEKKSNGDAKHARHVTSARRKSREEERVAMPVINWSKRLEVCFKSLRRILDARNRVNKRA